MGHPMIPSWIFRDRPQGFRGAVAYTTPPPPALRASSPSKGERCLWTAAGGGGRRLCGFQRRAFLLRYCPLPAQGQGRVQSGAFRADVLLALAPLIFGLKARVHTAVRPTRQMTTCYSDAEAKATLHCYLPMIQRRSVGAFGHRRRFPGDARVAFGRVVGEGGNDRGGLLQVIFDHVVEDVHVRVVRARAVG